MAVGFSAITAVGVLTDGSSAATPAGHPQTAAPAVVSHCSTHNENGKQVSYCLGIAATPQKKASRALPADVAKAASKSLVSPSPTGVLAPSDIPAVCAEGYSNPGRFVSCSNDGWTLTETETTDGVTTVVGQFPIQIASAAQFGIQNGLIWELSAAVYGDVPTGTLAKGVSGTMETGCRANSHVCQSTTSDGQPISITENSSSFGDWEQYDLGQASTTPGSIDTMDGFLGVVLYLTGSFGESIEVADSSSNTIGGRCDSVISPTECVDQYGPIAVSFDSTTTPAIAPVAQHVWTASASSSPTPLAIRWGNPYYSGTALTRDMNDADNKANNAAACSSVPTGPGQNCDEYPMASTHQGAAQPAGKGIFSAIAVPVSANNSQGGVLNNFYTLYHVLDGDAFYVEAVLPNGTTSW